jgi:hypothetical protein
MVLKEGNTVPEINLMKSMNGHVGGGVPARQCHAWEWPRKRADHPVPGTDKVILFSADQFLLNFLLLISSSYSLLGISVLSSLFNFVLSQFIA